MPQTIDGARWLTQQEIATKTGYTVTRVRSAVQILEATDQIKTRIDRRDGRSKLIRESDLEIVTRALNRGG